MNAQNSNQIAEVLEDGTIYAFDMDVCDQEAVSIIEGLHAKEGKLFNFDFSATVFTLFVYCIHILRDMGWTTHELLNEVLDHTQEYDQADGIMGFESDDSDDDGE